MRLSGGYAWVCVRLRAHRGQSTGCGLIAHHERWVEPFIVCRFSDSTRPAQHQSALCADSILRATINTSAPRSQTRMQTPSDTASHAVAQSHNDSFIWLNPLVGHTHYVNATHTHNEHRQTQQWVCWIENLWHCPRVAKSGRVTA